MAERTGDLVAYQEGSEAVLQWSYPSLTTAGDALTDVERVEVWRANLPLGQEPPPPATPQDHALRRQLLESQGEVVAVLDPEHLAMATRGSFLRFRDDLRDWQDEVGQQTEPMVIWYGVRTVCCRRQESELSNVVRLEPQEPPPPPVELRLRVGVEGVDLEWTQIPDTRVVVERSRDGATWSSLTAEPVDGGAWRDTIAAQGHGWSYRLRSTTTAADGSRVVGDPSQAARIDYPDMYPPEAPQKVVCLPEGTRVKVRWETVEEAVLYRVSRRVGGKKWRLIADDHRRLQYVDDAPPIGDLTYRVGAVDEAGNESESSTCTVVMSEAP
ncbi:MAG: hypothetical protein ACC742_07165 [Thermoanaerobaculales bacterium]